ncbi:glycosyltransferase [Skermania sp. ID1734]|uniref:glycosyltransferase n=1 Tax=Skermania sp. ID1734 TaxID=2597516 RepID=UPI00210263D2|nr:glycosyltransferase [Skermania sp. ID1734]
MSNRPDVLRDCLIRSVESHRSAGPCTEMIVVDNAQRQFPSAGAALNHGASMARNEVLVFVHQDVYLHSLARLEEVASAIVSDTGVGLVGATGMTARGELVGRIRDRVVLTGRACTGFVDVDSVDELLFIARRQQVLDSPLSESAQLSWHAYAVEYGARLRRAGKRVVVGPIPVTHNSLTMNLDQLTAAHHHVGLHYPEQVPLHTTCGTIDGRQPDRRKLLADHRWRYRWLQGSRKAILARRAIGRLPVVLSDIRFDLDGVLSNCDASSLDIVTPTSPEEKSSDFPAFLELDRHGRSIKFRIANLSATLELLSKMDNERSLLLTNIDLDFLRKARTIINSSSVLGYSAATGFWLLMGAAATAAYDEWRLPAATPLGARRHALSRTVAPCASTSNGRPTASGGSWFRDR